jgi:hypothetical protein
MKGMIDIRTMTEKVCASIILHDLRFDLHNFLITSDKELAYEMVIGMDFLLKHKLTLDCNRKIIKKQFNDDCEW